MITKKKKNLLEYSHQPMQFFIIKLKLNEQPHAIAPHTTTTTNLHEPTFCRTKPCQAKSVHHVILR